MNIFKYFCTVLLIISPISWGLPKVVVAYNKTTAGITQVRIENKTAGILACFVAIDGFKTKFQLRARARTQWISATDTRFNYRNFSTWCDYLDIHPKYKAYPLYPIV
jgi:hypothetical protein